MLPVGRSEAREPDVPPRIAAIPRAADTNTFRKSQAPPKAWSII